MTVQIAADGLDEVATAWLTHMTTVERTPLNTVKARVRTLRSVGRPGTMSREEVEAWWASRANLAPSTRQNDLANLRTFYRWAMVWEHRTDDPTIRIDAPKVPKGSPQWVTKPDLQIMLDTFPADLRRAVCLGAYAGLRVSEAAALNWPDIDVELHRARVFGKGQKYRTIAISPLLVDQLLPNTGGNVVTGDKPLTASVLQRRVNRAIKGAGIDATFHKLRHRYGTIALQRTGNLRAVADQMGHASVITTEGYAAADPAVADVIAEAVFM